MLVQRGDRRNRPPRWGKLAKLPIPPRRRLALRTGLCVVATCLVAGNVLAVSLEAQEYMDIQSKMAPDQCALQKLSSQAAAAQRDGDRGKRQELMAQMEPIAKRIQTFQPRLQTLSKYVPPNSPDYAAVSQHLQQLRAKCK